MDAKKHAKELYEKAKEITTIEVNAYRICLLAIGELLDANGITNETPTEKIALNNYYLDLLKELDKLRND